MSSYFKKVYTAYSVPPQDRTPEVAVLLLLANKQLTKFNLCMTALGLPNIPAEKLQGATPTYKNFHYYFPCGFSVDEVWGNPVLRTDLEYVFSNFPELKDIMRKGRDTVPTKSNIVICGIHNVQLMCACDVTSCKFYKESAISKCGFSEEQSTADISNVLPLSRIATQLGTTEGRVEEVTDKLRAIYRAKTEGLVGKISNLPKMLHGIQGLCSYCASVQEDATGEVPYICATCEEELGCIETSILLTLNRDVGQVCALVEASNLEEHQKALFLDITIKEFRDLKDKHNIVEKSAEMKMGEVRTDNLSVKVQKRNTDKDFKFTVYRQLVANFLQGLPSSTVHSQLEGVLSMI